MSQFFSAKSLVVAIALAFGVAPAFAQQPAASTSVIEISAQPLGDALNQLARQVHMELIVQPALVAGKTATAVSGRLTPQQAFDQLLRGSGLVAVIDGSIVVIASSGVPLSSLPAVEVIGSTDLPSEGSQSYAYRSSRGATGLNLSQRETPQSVSIITRNQIDDFHLNNINDVLDATPSVVAERVESDRTYYTARGFNITTFQEDGVGIPFPMGLVGGDIDVALYDRIEILRGANSMLTNTGTPSATVNMIRKRPTHDFQAAVNVSYGSWNTGRIHTDVSSALNESGTLRGRAVMAQQQGNSYLDRYTQNKNIFYGVLEADVASGSTISLGYTRQQNASHGQMWGGIPLYYTDGTPTNYARSTSTAADWTYLDTINESVFAEFAHRLENNWQFKAVYTHKTVDWNGKLLWAGNLPDRTTGLAAANSPSYYEFHNLQDVFDVRLSGPFSLLGREHELTLGASAARSQVRTLSVLGTGTVLPSLEIWNGSMAEPAFNIAGGSGDFTDKQNSVFAATRLNLRDNFKLILGGNSTHIESAGINYGTVRNRSDSKVTPYAGLVWDLDQNISAYISYTKIFNPQLELGRDQTRLAPVTGENTEVGLKSEWLNKRLLASLSVFQSEQSNLASNPVTSGVLTLYEGKNVRSRGLEVEVSGELTSRLNLSAGYTKLSLTDDEGKATRLYTPRQIFRVSTVYRMPTIDKLRVGGGLNWRSSTGTTNPVTVVDEVRQRAYALLNLMARYDFSDKLSLSLNIHNVTDKKYLSSLYYGGEGYYGPSRNATVALNWKY